MGGREISHPLILAETFLFLPSFSFSFFCSCTQCWVISLVIWWQMSICLQSIIFLPVLPLSYDIHWLLNHWMPNVPSKWTSSVTILFLFHELHSCSPNHTLFSLQQHTQWPSMECPCVFWVCQKNSKTMASLWMHCGQRQVGAPWLLPAGVQRECC